MLAVFITITVLFFGSCQPDDKELGALATPENLIVETTIVGQDADNPYGDGSGKVIFKAMADNALSYEFVTANSSNVSANGEIEIPFTINGINTYNLVVVASGTGGLKTSTQIEVKVFASFQLPSFLLEKLARPFQELPVSVYLGYLFLMLKMMQYFYAIFFSNSSITNSGT